MQAKECKQEIVKDVDVGSNTCRIYHCVDAGDDFYEVRIKNARSAFFASTTPPSNDEVFFQYDRYLLRRHKQLVVISLALMAVIFLLII